MADAIDISRGTCAKIRQTLFWGFIYNVVGMPLAAFGLLSPVIAGAAMAFRSVSVAVADLERRMAAMADMRDSLKHLADCCQGDQRPDCPMLEALSGHKVAAP